MLKICIVTFSRENNFGAMLQSYGLQNYLQQNGYYVDLLDYKMNTNKQCKKSIVNEIKKTVRKIKDHRNNVIKAKKFLFFQDKYLNYSLKKYIGEIEIEKDSPMYDVFIAGSDQIWNSDITNGDKTFFLHFAKGKRISYAASLGKEFFTEVEKANISVYLSNFDSISVRESSAKELLKSTYNIESEVVLDPVFLIKKNQWNTLAQSDYVIPYKYIFVYVMEPSSEMNKYSYELSKITGYNIIFISSTSKKVNIKGMEIKSAGPQDFLYLIKNAEYVITNSFHGLAFSIILEKKFICIAHSTRNTRLQNLMKLIDKNDFIIPYEGNKQIELHKIVDGQEALIKLNDYILQSKQFLHKALMEH